MGVTKTRERLLDEANGKYIFWLDQDDYLEPTLLEKAVKAFETSGADVVTWGMFFLTSSGKNIVNYVDEFGIEQFKKNTLWGLCPTIYGYAAKKELWAERERVPTDVDIAEDVWFTSQIIPKAKTIFSIKESLYYYNSANEGSFSKIPTADNISRGAFVYYKVIKRNQKLCPSEIPLCLKIARTLLLDVYCFNKLDHSLTKYQEELTMIALKDLFQSYPQKKIKRLYLIQFCALRGIDFMCRWYGRHRIKRLKRRNK